jgi:hypothetical protein
MPRRSHRPNPESPRRRWSFLALLATVCLALSTAGASAAGYLSPTNTLVITPAAGVFGSVAVGTTSPVMTITVTNDTNASMGYLGYSNLGEFYLQPGTCHLVSGQPMLAPGQSCSFTAVFKPTKAGPVTGNLSIQTSAGTFNVPMSGTGAALVIVPTNPNYGTLAVGKTSVTRSFAVTNYTTAAATYTGQTGSSAFKVQPGTCTLVSGTPMLASGASCAFTVYFVPAVPGTAMGALNISTNVGPVVFSMTGTGAGTSAAPVANAGGPYSGSRGVPLTFHGSASTAPTGQTITAYNWNFGDGTSGTGASPVHAYANVGTYNVSLTVTDTAGLTNTVTTTAQIALPPNPVSIRAVVSPAPNAAGWNNSAVTVSFVCTTTGSPIVSCPGPQRISSDVANDVVSGTVRDAAGDTASASATVNLETIAPAISIASPANNATISLSTTTIGVNGTVTSDVATIVSVTCNGAAAVVSGTAFTCTATLTPGANTVSVVAKDIAGNTRTVPLSLTFAQAPAIHILSPANLGVTNLTPVTINGTVSDPNATVTVDGVSVPQSGGAFSTPVPLVEGLNVLTAVATNAAGISSTATIEVTLDTTPPHVAINSPANGSVLTASSVTVTGLANDVVVGTVNLSDLTVTVNGVAAQVANRSFSALSVPLALGPNTIQATGTDRAGSSAMTSVVVTRVLASQPPTPAIGRAVLTQWVNIVSGNNQTGVAGSALSAPIVVSLTDSASHPLVNQTVVFKVTQNNGLVSSGNALPASAAAVTTDANGKAQVVWTLGKRAGAGNNTLQVSSAQAVSPVTFTATGTTGGAALIVVDSGNNQTGVIGQPLPFPFVVDVVDSGHNRVPGVPVIFTVKQGGGTFAGAATPSTTTVTTDSNGRAITILTEGLQAGTSNIVEASFAGNAGAPAAFVATAKAPGNPSATTISGVVLDNSNQPIQNVTIRLYMQYQGTGNNLPVQVGTPVVTNAQGAFVIAPAPVGSYKLMADGSTATGAGSYPTLEYDIVTVAGNDNTVGMPIYLPALDTVNKVCVDETHGGILTLPQYPGFALNIAAGSATFPGGSRSGCVSATPVNGDKVPMAPGFGQQPRFIVTIQPVGTIFNPPAAMTLPNVDGLAPKAVTEMYSYDHDLAMFVAIGTGTVSNDGSVIQSDPGVGVVKAGWHCGGDPNTTGSAATCPECQKCTGDSCVADASQDGNACSIGTCVMGTCEPYEYDPGDPLRDTYSVPLVKAPTGIGVSPSEKVIFNIQAQDQDRKRPIGTTAWTDFTGTGPYLITLTVSGPASWNSAGSGTQTLTFNSEQTGNAFLFVDSSWTGTPGVSVSAKLQDMAPATVPPPDTGSVKDPDYPINWSIVKRTACPTTMQTISGTTGVFRTDNPAVYGYQMGPPLPPPASSPYYENQTILESFGAVTAYSFSMSDLTPAFKAANPTLTTPDMVAAYFFGGGNNGTFVIDGNDQIFDQHGRPTGSGIPGFSAAFTPAAYARGIGYVLPQTYSCNGNAVQSYTIKTLYTNGVPTIEKSGP